MIDVLASYAGRTVYVTGSSSGIGEAVARTLIEGGADVVGVDLKEPGYQGLSGFVPVDLGEAASIAAAASALPAHLDAIFHCAGIATAAADPLTVLRVNFIGLRELLELTVDRVPRGGAVALTASTASRDFADTVDDVIGLVRTTGFSEAVAWAEAHEDYVTSRGGYPVSKDAIALFTVDRCFDFGERGVRLNTVAPGLTATPILDTVAKNKGAGFTITPPAPLGYICTAQEQANLLIFLNSPWASYVNGLTIFSDGGALARRILPD
ncbi:SDR family oxidoreductase [Nocardioides sp. WS12]|uniref:SDR family oxidoreductase n=1 Tax=Nocardioides sp. WS12 TaxID=2486272 RepID=UPI0015FAB998|nr:SDR family oxidoreductase [Nocardioides sp. WS12]